MLRVLYKVRPESLQTQGGPVVDKKVIKGPETGAQKAAPKKPEGAFKAPRAQKAREASKKEDEARAREILASIDDDVTSSLNDLQAIETQRVVEERSGKAPEVSATPTKKMEAYDEDGDLDTEFAFLNGLETAQRNPNIIKDDTPESLVASLHDIQAERVKGMLKTEAPVDNSDADSIELDLDDAFDAEPPTLDRFATPREQGRGRAEVADELATLLGTDGEKAMRAMATNEKAQQGQVLVGEDFDDLDLDALLNADLDAAAPPKAEGKVQLSPTMQVEAAAMKQAEAKAAQPGRKTEIFPLDHVSLPKISENLPPGEREDQLMSLRRTLQAGTEAEYQQLLALEEAYDRATPGPARDALEHQTIALRGRIDQRVFNEFCADHDDPAEAQKYYGGLAARKAELLKNPEARRVLEKLDEQRGSGGWTEGEYITQEMIDELNAGTERDLARAWHRLEHDQGVMAHGLEQIRNERHARMDVDRLQFKLIRNGEDLGIPPDVVAAFQNPNVNRGDLSRVADQVLVNLDKYDVPQTFGERAWSAGLALARVFGKDSLFGRRRANAEVNALQIAKDDHDKLVRMRQAGKNAAVLEHGSGAPGFMIATDFGSSFRRGPSESGVALTSGGRGEKEPTLSPEQAQDLQSILSEAQKSANDLIGDIRKAATAEARRYLIDDAEEAAGALQARLLKYVDTPAARSRAFELANQQVHDLEEAITEALPDEGWINKSPARQAEAAPASAKRSEAIEAAEDLTSLLDTEDDEDLGIEITDDLGGNYPETLKPAQLQTLEEGTERLEGSHRVLREAIRGGQVLEGPFVQSLSRYLQDNRERLMVFKHRGLNNNAAFRELEQAVNSTQALLDEYRLRESDSRDQLQKREAGPGIRKAVDEAKALEAELNSSNLWQADRILSKLEKLRAVADRYRKGPEARLQSYQLLDEMVTRINARVTDTLSESALPAMSEKGRKRDRLDALKTEQAIQLVDKASADMLSDIQSKTKLDSASYIRKRRGHLTNIDKIQGFLDSNKGLSATGSYQELNRSLADLRGRFARWERMALDTTNG